MEYTTIKEICSYLPKSKIKAGEGLKTGLYPFFTSSDTQSQFLNDYLYDDEVVILGTGGKPSCNYYKGKFATSTDNFILKCNTNFIAKYLYYRLRVNNLEILQKGFHGAGLQHLGKDYLNDIKIKNISLHKQQEIVSILDKINAIIDADKKRLGLLDEAVKSRFIEMFGDITIKTDNTVKLGSICKTMGGGTPTTKRPEFYDGDIPWITTVSLGPNYIDGSNAKGYITQEAIDNSATKLIPVGSVMVGTRVGVGKCSINTEPICTNQDINSIINLDSRFNNLFIKHVVDAYQEHFDSIKKGATILGITTDDLKDINVPNVSLNRQNDYEEFVKLIDKSKFNAQQHLNLMQELLDKKMEEYFGGE